MLIHTFDCCHYFLALRSCCLVHLIKSCLMVQSYKTTQFPNFTQRKKREERYLFFSTRFLIAVLFLRSMYNFAALNCRSLVGNFRPSSVTAAKLFFVNRTSPTNSDKLMCRGPYYYSSRD